MTNEEKNLICEWFGHLEQLATDHKTQNGYVMSEQDCFDEMVVLAHNCKEFVEKFYDNPDAFKEE